jgi:hypothetical protein
MPLVRTHGGGRLGADTLPFSVRWLVLSFIHGAVLAYRQRPHTPCPATWHRASHPGRSGGGRRRHEHDTHAICGRRHLHGTDTAIAAHPEGPSAYLAFTVHRRNFVR